MPRIGGMYGPDVTFLGVGQCDLEDPASFAGADVVVIGAPYDAARRIGQAPVSARG